MTAHSYGHVLTPLQAIEAANGVYQILYTTHIASAFPRIIKDNFEIANATQFDGKSGLTLAQTKTGFGIIAMGKQNKGVSAGQDFSRDALVAIRGTKEWFDWITDFHAGAQFIDGKLVHSGFYKVYRSILSPISHFFRQHKPRRVHIVGHSLGGAVAVLIANWIQKNASAEPILYTFGAPRVGSGPFARHFTAKIKPKNIYRVYHANDPIPMVPVWPFMHAPDPGRTYCVHYFGSHIAINPFAHYRQSYITSMKGHNTWGSFPHKAKMAPTDAEIRRWLLSKNMSSHLSWAEECYYFAHAAMYLLRQAGALLLDMVEMKIMDKSDHMDILAMVCEHRQLSAALVYAAEAEGEQSKLYQQLIGKMMHLLGMTYDATKKLSIEMLHQLFMQMQRRLYSLARTALHAG